MNRLDSPMPYKNMLRTIASAILAFFFFVGPSFAGVALDRVVAVVNREVITWNELYRAMESEMGKQIRAPFQRLSEEQKRRVFKENEAAFLESMIDMELQLQEAGRLGMRVSDNDIDNAVEEIKQRYAMDDEAFGAALEKDGFSLQSYREMLSRQILTGRVVERQVRAKLLLTEQESEGFLKQEGGELYGIRQIFFKAIPGKDSEEAEERASMLYGKLKAGEDFQALARKHSEEQAAETTGGYLGLIDKSQMAGEFLDALKGMKPGDVSRPFRTERGIHIIKLEEIKDKRDILLEERFKELYMDWLQGLREKSLIEIRL